MEEALSGTTGENSFRGCWLAVTSRNRHAASTSPRPTAGKGRWAFPRYGDRIVQRAMLMATESPSGKSDFHRLSYGFPTRAQCAPLAIRTVKFQLQDSTYRAGRWVIEGDLASYFDTVQPQTAAEMPCGNGYAMSASCPCSGGSSRQATMESGPVLRSQSRCSSRRSHLAPLFVQYHASTSLISGWKGNTSAIRLARTAGHGTSALPKGAPSPSVRTGNGNLRWPTAAMPMTSMIIVKGNKAHAEDIREECRAFLEGELKLTLNMGKTHITHVNNGFTFLGASYRIIRKRGPKGTMRRGHHHTQGQITKLRRQAGQGVVRQL